MKDKLFTAILAKNDIARELRDYKNGEPISPTKIVHCLTQIEEYLGVANQPSVEDIINNEKFRL